MILTTFFSRVYSSETKVEKLTLDEFMRKKAETLEVKK